MIPAALVLAGTRPGGDLFAQEMGVSHKALLTIDGTPLLERVLGALRDAGIERVLVSADDPAICKIALDSGAEISAPGGGPSASVATAFKASDGPMLVTTSDHGLLRGEWVRELIENTPADADLSLMMAERTRVEQAVPGTRRTYLRFADGHWSGCNLFYLKTPAAARALETWSTVEADRKRPWRIASRLGVGTLGSMVLGRLTLEEGLARLGKRIGVNPALVPASDGLAAVDVDKPGDLELVRALVSQQKMQASPSRD